MEMLGAGGAQVVLRDQVDELGRGQMTKLSSHARPGEPALLGVGEDTWERFA